MSQFHENFLQLQFYFHVLFKNLPFLCTITLCFCGNAAMQEIAFFLSTVLVVSNFLDQWRTNLISIITDFGGKHVMQESSYPNTEPFEYFIGDDGGLNISEMFPSSIDVNWHRNLKCSL